MTIGSLGPSTTIKIFCNELTVRKRGSQAENESKKGAKIVDNKSDTGKHHGISHRPDSNWTIEG
jgi:hypothetical protein